MSPERGLVWLARVARSLLAVRVFNITAGRQLNR